MAKSANQKLKLTYLIKILKEETDEDHRLTTPQLIERLAAYDIKAERKSIYSDIDDMREYLGLDIIKIKENREVYYYMASREFELAEIKMLIDSVQASKFITARKSKELINKIKGLANIHAGKELQRQLLLTDRVKTENTMVYNNVDEIYNAINQNKKITFQYFQWNVKGELEPRRNGAYYVVSPWALIWDDEYYYLVAYDEETSADQDGKGKNTSNSSRKKAKDAKDASSAPSPGIIKHFRVDKMKRLSTLEQRRQGKDTFDKKKFESYSKTRFRMYDGELRPVHIQFRNDLCGLFLDRFGKDITIRPVDEAHSEIRVEVAVSNQFFAWIFGLGKDVKVTGPEDVVKKMKEAATDFLQNYT